MDIRALVLAVGYAGVGAIIFAESGILLGIIFPGDSLLFTAGVLASQGIFNIVALSAMCALAAVAGDSVGYTFGRRVGKRFFKYPESLFFNHDNVERARAFYARHGGKTIVLARFLPGIRTLAPIIAGVGDMPYRTFLSYNVVGGVMWGAGVTSLGYFLGSVIPGVDKYLLLIVVGIIVLSVLPSVWGVVRNPAQRQRLRQGWLKWWRRSAS